MVNLSIVGDKTTIICSFLVPWQQIVRLGLGLGLGFLVLLFRVRVKFRVRVRVIITLLCIRFLREESFFYLFFTI